MEESKKFSAPSTTYTSQPLQTNTSGMVDNRVPTNAVRMFASDKSNHTAISSTVPMVCIPTHISAGSSAALQYQSTSNEVRPPIVSGVMPNNHMGRNPSSVALPRVENPQFKVTGGLSGAPYVLQVQGNFNKASHQSQIPRGGRFTFIIDELANSAISICSHV
jgi:hypothetical protein